MFFFAFFKVHFSAKNGVSISIRNCIWTCRILFLMMLIVPLIFQFRFVLYFKNFLSLIIFTMCALQMQVYVFQRGPPEMGRSSCDALVYNSVMYIQLPRLLREDSKSSSRCCKQPKKVVESWLCFYGVCVPEPTLSYSLGFSISSSHIIDFHQEAPFCFLC